MTTTSPETGIPWCKSCKSYHVEPRDQQHKDALGCTAGSPKAQGKCPICGDPAPIAACCGGYACTKSDRLRAEAQPQGVDLLPCCPFCGHVPEPFQRMVQRDPPLHKDVAICQTKGCALFQRFIDMDRWVVRADLPRTRETTVEAALAELREMVDQNDDIEFRVSLDSDGHRCYWLDINQAPFTNADSYHELASKVRAATRTEGEEGINDVRD